MRFILKFLNSSAEFCSKNAPLLRLAAGAAFLCASFLALFKPAAALRVCALALPLMAALLLRPFRRKVPSSFKGLLLMFPFFTVLLWLRTFFDTAALWTAAFAAIWSGFRSLETSGRAERIAAVTAFAAGAVLLWQSFTADWFAILPAVILTFFAAGFKELACPSAGKKS